MDVREIFDGAENNAVHNEFLCKLLEGRGVAEVHLSYINESWYSYSQDSYNS